MDPISIAGAAVTAVTVLSDTYKTIKRITGLPKAFDVVNDSLPLLQATLEATKARLQLPEAPKVFEAIEPTIRKCKEDTEKLREIFQKIEQECGELSGNWEDCYKIVYIKWLKSTKAGKVEDLMADVWKNVDKLSVFHIFQNLVTEDDLGKIESVRDELSKVEPSVADSELDTGSIHASQNVTGDNAQQNNTVGGSHKFIAGGSFGPVGSLNYARSLQIFNFDSGRERPSSPPNPKSTLVPYYDDGDFIERGEILQRIEELCSRRAGRAALVGLSGVGKSKLAKRHAYNVKSKSQKWVFWVHASSAAKIEDGFRVIANAAKIQEHLTVDIFKRVHDWLGNEVNGEWLLVLDSLDNDENLEIKLDGREPLSLIDYLPQSPNGSILVTSQYARVARKLMGHDKIIPVKPMIQSDAVLLFKKKVTTSEEDDAVKLVEALDRIPIAISHAAAYISERHISVGSYLDKLAKGDGAKARLLDDPNNNDASILDTWQISFEHIRTKRPSAAELLGMMSFLTQGIPKFLLLSDQGSDGDQTESRNGEDDNGSQQNPSDDLEDDLFMLRNFCMINANQVGDDFEMHRLVQLSMRRWLKKRPGKLEETHSHCLQRIWGSWRTNSRIFLENVDSRSSCYRMTKLYLHAKAALDSRPQPGETKLMLPWIRLVLEVAKFGPFIWKFEYLKTLVLDALKFGGRVLGEKHKIVLKLRSALHAIEGAEKEWDRYHDFV